MQIVIGAFEDRDTAQRAVERLVVVGFDRDDVHVEQGVPAGTAAGAGSASSADARETDEHRGVLASIGHMFTSLFGQDDPQDRPGMYTEAVRRGTSVVVVEVEDGDLAERAAGVLHEQGAIDVDERARQWRADGWTSQSASQAAGLAGTADTANARSQPTSDEAQRAQGEQALAPGRAGVVDVVQEELKVGKRSVDHGGVRVVQRVSQQPVRELVRLREERVAVDRRPVDRPANAADLANVGEGTIEVRETAEEPVVAKTARVVEEVRVSKDVQEREQTVEDTVRRKDVDVERIEGEGPRVEREDRAFASGAGDSEPQSRDPDAGQAPSGRKTLRVKPTEGKP